MAQLEAFCALVANGLTLTSAAQLVRGSPVRSTEQAPDTADSPNTRPPHPGDRAAVRGLLSAVLRLDADTVTRTVERCIATAGVVQAWDLLCVPALVEVGRRTATSGGCIDAEHLLSSTLSAVLHRVTGPPPGPGRGVLLSCAPGERHTLALEALHAALTERAAPVRSLGADLPIPALRDAVHRTHPFAVVIWAQTDRTARVGQLAQLHSPDSTAVVAVGPGWARRQLPPGVLSADTLSAAIGLLLLPGAGAATA